MKKFRIVGDEPPLTMDQIVHVLVLLQASKVRLFGVSDDFPQHITDIPDAVTLYPKIKRFEIEEEETK